MAKNQESRKKTRETHINDLVIWSYQTWTLKKSYMIYMFKNVDEKVGKFTWNLFKIIKFKF